MFKSELRVFGLRLGVSWVPLTLRPAFSIRLELQVWYWGQHPSAPAKPVLNVELLTTICGTSHSTVVFSTREKSQRTKTANHRNLPRRILRGRCVRHWAL
ncbi:uncharacterized protein BDZ83DRAFT_609846 [Colletotrichum acutatum]|uniref:Uncharacterized protein n=1 Tax=Glomerella acutata TaxID=27357 RepID=A0AAD8UWF5_GLOAC|nr:uncharacterized protein BDZ83DRAFT_609846 [Colletotrichum acutatum]KAK1728304.1 hypothetical protein BDZ83DRAFT_609846 [Colletotrichum acutatum]